MGMGLEVQNKRTGTLAAYLIVQGGNTFYDLSPQWCVSKAFQQGALQRWTISIANKGEGEYAQVQVEGLLSSHPHKPRLIK